MLPKGRLLSDAEWRAYGVQQSRAWAARGVCAARQRRRLLVLLLSSTASLASRPSVRPCRRMGALRATPAGAAYPALSAPAGHRPQCVVACRLPGCRRAAAAAPPPCAAPRVYNLAPPPPLLCLQPRAR